VGAGFAPDSRHLLLGELKQRRGELPTHRPVAFICQSGRGSAWHRRRLTTRSL
jgi:hypothetical protein